jgi:hypothetical protein
VSERLREITDATNQLFGQYLADADAGAREWLLDEGGSLFGPGGKAYGVG